MGCTESTVYLEDEKTAELERIRAKREKIKEERKLRDDAIVRMVKHWDDRSRESRNEEQTLLNFDEMYTEDDYVKIHGGPSAFIDENGCISFYHFGRKIKTGFVFASASTTEIHNPELLDPISSING